MTDVAAGEIRSESVQPVLNRETLSLREKKGEGGGKSGRELETEDWRERVERERVSE